MRCVISTLIFCLSPFLWLRPHAGHPFRSVTKWKVIDVFSSLLLSHLSPLPFRPFSHNSTKLDPTNKSTSASTQPAKIRFWVWSKVEKNQIFWTIKPYKFYTNLSKGNTEPRLNAHLMLFPLTIPCLILYYNTPNTHRIFLEFKFKYY